VRVLSVGNMYPPHHFGGYELIWESTVEFLRKRGHEVRVLTTDVRTDTDLPDAEDVFRELRWKLVEGDFEASGPIDRLRLVRHNHRVLRRHIADFEPTVVAWWSMGGLSLTLLEDVRRRGIPAVAFVIDEWLDYGRKVDQWLRTFTGPRRSRVVPLAEGVARVPARVDFAAAAKYLFVSEHTRDEALASGLDLNRVGILNAGIDSAFLDPAPVRDWEWQLLYLGRIDPRKGIDTAVEALIDLPAEATLRIVGGWDAREEERLRELSARLGVDGRVVFEGHRNGAELRAAYGECDAVVFPVRWDEPWGLVPLEAMGRGRPVVATGRGGSGEYLRDGENCLIFEAGDPRGLAGALRRLASDQELRTVLRSNGMELAARHTAAAFNERAESELLDAAAHSGGARPRP
jgi:glycogen synthase